MSARPDVVVVTSGRSRLGLGSHVKAHIERRYGMDFDPPGPRMRDYLLAVRDTLAAFRGERPLAHAGRYYQLSLLPDQWRPPMPDHGDIRVDVSAVGPGMTTMAGEVGRRGARPSAALAALPRTPAGAWLAGPVPRSGSTGRPRTTPSSSTTSAFDGTLSKLNERLKAGDQEGLAATITDEMLDVYAIVGRWDEIDHAVSAASEARES